MRSILVRTFSRVRRAAAFLQDLLEAPSDPLEEDPFFVLTKGERESIAARRDTMTDAMVRSDVTALLDAVERLGAKMRHASEVLESALRSTQPASESRYSIAALRAADILGRVAPQAKTTPSLLTWLSEPWSEMLPWSTATNPLVLVTSEPTRLQVLAALVGMNGGMDAAMYGTFTQGGPYGRMGLSAIDEVVTLVHFNAFVLGWKTATGENTDAVEHAISSEIARASVARVAAMHPLESAEVPTKTMSARATVLYVDGEKVADLSDVIVEPDDLAVCSICMTAHAADDCCQA